MQFKFGLQDVKIATWNDVGDYGTPVDVIAAQLMSSEFQTVNAMLEGDDILADTHARQISAQVRVRFGFKNLNVLGVITGQDLESSGNVLSMVFGDANYPYFCMAGKIDHTAGTGNDILFIPKMKLMEGFSLSAEYGQYMTPEITATAIWEGATYGMGKLFQYPIQTLVTLPPAESVVIP